MRADTERGHTAFGREGRATGANMSRPGPRVRASSISPLPLPVPWRLWAMRGLVVAMGLLAFVTVCVPLAAWLARAIVGAMLGGV